MLTTCSASSEEIRFIDLERDRTFVQFLSRFILFYFFKWPSISIRFILVDSRRTCELNPTNLGTIPFIVLGLTNVKQTRERLMDKAGS